MNRILCGRAAAFVASALMLNPTVQAASADVRIADTGFEPKVVTVNQGDEVFWFNEGTEVHSAKAANGEWNSGRIPPLDYFATFLTHTGAFTYACSQHPTVTGLVTVVTAVVPPTVGVFFPADMTRFGQPATFSFQVLANDSDGTVSNVVFLADSSALATNQSGPFNLAITNLAAGNHVLTARATDDQGHIGFSAPVNITVTAPGGGTTRFVDIEAGQFTPGGLNVTVGDTVIFRNLDAVNHTATGTFASREALCGSTPLTATSSCSNTFLVPGVFPYFCGLHPSERGTVTVSRATGGPLVLMSPTLDSSGRFQFDIGATTGFGYVVERSSAFPAEWIPILTNTAATNSLRYMESQPTVPGAARFYRVQRLP